MNLDPYRSLVARYSPGAVLHSMERLTGGVSADVFRLEIQTEEGSHQVLVLRVHGATHSGHPADLEHRLLQTLHQRGVLVPQPLHLDTSGGLLPEPFLMMEFVAGSTQIEIGGESDRIEAMAKILADIHAVPIDGLPELPTRLHPVPEVLDYLPDGAQWQALRSYLESLGDASGVPSLRLAPEFAPKLLHGDFWPENLLWHKGELAAILDWEDAAIGDPLSDVACACVELRYKFGTAGMQQFTDAYVRHARINPQRLALWQVYVAAAAQCFMGEWRLEPKREAHMRKQALATLREAGALLTGNG